MHKDIVDVYRKCACHALWLLSLPLSTPVIMTTIRRSSNCSRKTVLRLRFIIIVIAYRRGWNPKDLAHGEGGEVEEMKKNEWIVLCRLNTVSREAL